MKQILLLIAFWLPVCAFSQLKETFLGPNVTSANQWRGDTSRFVINDKGMLQLYALENSGSVLLYIYGASRKENEWQFMYRSTYKSTNRNYCKIYIWSERSDPEDTGEAYFVRMGYSTPVISLFKQTGNRDTEEIITGKRTLFHIPEKQTNGVFNEVLVKVVLGTDGICHLYTKSSKDKEFVEEGKTAITPSSKLGYFMLQCFYTGNYSRSKMFDDISIRSFNGGKEPGDPTIPEDISAPVLETLSVLDANELLLEFDEEVDVTESSFILSGIGETDEVYVSEDNLMVKLVFTSKMQKGKNYTLSYSDVFDKSGNKGKGSFSFLYDEEEADPPVSQQGVIRINEIMADPKGVKGLPETEYVEIYNTSNTSIVLDDWQFVYGGKGSAIKKVTLPAYAYAVLYKSGRTVHLDEGGVDVPLSGFPAYLANDGKTLELRDEDGVLIDEVTYEKATPGKSWEWTIDGWRLSLNSRGGTPGSRNIRGEVEPEEPDEPEEPELIEVESLDIVINELLPEPYLGASEYIELYNRSDKLISLKGLSIAVRKSDGTLGTLYSLGTIKEPLEAMHYILLTSSKENVVSFYTALFPEVIYELKLPVLANTTSTVVLLRDADKMIIDEVCYSSKWHASSILSYKGVSLERIDPEGLSQNSLNWTSASESIGFGTPGYQNSQYMKGSHKEEPTNIETPVFSDQTGLYEIYYRMDAPGYYCRIYVFDVSGRKKAEIAIHELIGTDGVLNWDGTALDGKRMMAGVYIFYAELVRENGVVKRYKKPFLVHP